MVHGIGGQRQLVLRERARIGNRLLIPDTTDRVVSGRSTGVDSYRFEVRKGNESFIVTEHSGIQAPGVLTERFRSMAQQFGAVVVSPES